MNYVILIIGLGLIVYDFYLIQQGELTISQRCQKLARPAIDWCIAIGGIVFLCFAKKWFPELDFALAVFLAMFWGHIWAANKERYGR